MPGWIIWAIGLTLLILGLIKYGNALVAIGILLLAIAIYLLIMGRVVHKTLEK